MNDKPELPPGWEWDPEGVGADQYEASAGPTEETMRRVTQEVVDEAWAIYRKRWAEALAEGARQEQARWEAEIDSILGVAGDRERAALFRLHDLMLGKASYQPNALEEIESEALAEGEKVGIRKGLEMARDLTCPRCADLEHNPLGTGAYEGRHVFAGDVLGYCVATEIRRALKGETP